VWECLDAYDAYVCIPGGVPPPIGPPMIVAPIITPTAPICPQPHQTTRASRTHHRSIRGRGKESTKMQQRDDTVGSTGVKRALHACYSNCAGPPRARCLDPSPHAMYLACNAAHKVCVRAPRAWRTPPAAPSGCLHYLGRRHKLQPPPPPPHPAHSHSHSAPPTRSQGVRGVTNSPPINDGWPQWPATALNAAAARAGKGII
jgi:hypothetical protein